MNVLAAVRLLPEIAYVKLTSSVSETDWLSALKIIQFRSLANRSVHL